MITSRTLEIHTILYFKLWADIKLALAFRQVFFLLRYFLHDASSVNDTKKIYFFCSATETHSLCLSFRFFFFVSATYEYVRRRLIGQITYTNWVLCIRFVLGSCLSLTLNTTVKCVCFECPLSLSPHSSSSISVDGLMWGYVMWFNSSVRRFFSILYKLFAIFI